VPDFRTRLFDILEAIDAVAEIVTGFDLLSYSADYKARRAVERCVEIISEATRHIPSDLTSEFPNVPWREIAAIGNLLRHEYYRVDDVIMWKIATQFLVELRPAIVQLQLRSTPDQEQI